MTVDIDRVKRLLDPDEPNYAAVASIGPPALPALGRLVAGSDAALAAKAAAAAGGIDDPGALEVIRQAANNRSPLVRLAAAQATRTTRAPGAAGLILALTRDTHPGVRKFAIKAAATRPNDGALAARVREMHASDPSPAIRTVAAHALRSSGTRIA